jgi:hypothetical protein
VHDSQAVETPLNAPRPPLVVGATRAMTASKCDSKSATMAHSRIIPAAKTPPRRSIARNFFAANNLAYRLRPAPVYILHR